MNYPPYGGGGGGYSVGGFSPSGPPGYGGGGGYPSPPHPYGPAVQVRTHKNFFPNENFWGNLTVLTGFPFPTPTVRRQLPLLRPHSWRVPLSAVHRRRVPLPVLQHGPGGLPRPGNGLPPAVPSAAAASPVRPRWPRRSERVPQAWDGRWRRIVSGNTKRRILTKRTAFYLLRADQPLCPPPPRHGRHVQVRPLLRGLPAGGARRVDQAGADRGCQEQPKPNLAEEVQREQVGGSCLKYTQEMRLLRNYAGVLLMEMFFSKRC